jgi:hypothetical protein
MRIRVTPTDGDTYEVDTNLYVLVAWERKFKRKASDLATGGVGIEDLAFMAYEACRVHNVTVPAIFDDYIRKMQHIEIVGDEPENPTDGAPTDTH